MASLAIGHYGHSIQYLSQVADLIQGIDGTAATRIRAYIETNVLYVLETALMTIAQSPPVLSLPDHTQLPESDGSPDPVSTPLNLLEELSGVVGVASPLRKNPFYW